MKKNKKFLLVSALGICLLVIGFLVTDYVKEKVLESSKKSELISFKYIGEFRNNFLSVSDGEKYGYVNSEGKVIFPLEHNLAFSIEEDDYLNNYYFVDGIAQYYADGKYGIIDENGNIVLESYYEDLTIYSKDIIIAVDFDGAYIINMNDKRKTEDPYLQIYSNELDFNNFIVDTFDSKSGIINKDGEILVNFEYDNIKYFYNNSETDYIIVLSKGNQTSILTKDLKEVKISNISLIHWFEDGLLSYSDDKNIVHIYDINNQKDEVYDSKYSFVYKNTDGLSLVTKDGKYGYINNSKEEVIEAKYNYSATEFINGYSSVCNASDSGIECGVIDKTGKEVIELKYDDIKVLSNNNFIIMDGESMYVLDLSGNKLTSEYKYIKEVENGKYFIVMDKDEKVGILDSNYKVFEELKYADIKYNNNVFTLKVENGFYLLKV